MSAIKGIVLAFEGPCTSIFKGCLCRLLLMYAYFSSTLLLSSKTDGKNEIIIINFLLSLLPSLVVISLVVIRDAVVSLVVFYLPSHVANSVVFVESTGVSI